MLDCDLARCKGPIKHYEHLKCKPIFENQDDCCPIRYDCLHLEHRSPNNCYANNHEYSIGEKIRDEDQWDKCLHECFCTQLNEELG